MIVFESISHVFFPSYWLHNHSTQNASLQYLFLYAIANVRKFCLSIIGKYFWNDFLFIIETAHLKLYFKNAIFEDYFAQY